MALYMGNWGYDPYKWSYSSTYNWEGPKLYIQYSINPVNDILSSSWLRDLFSMATSLYLTGFQNGNYIGTIVTSIELCSWTSPSNILNKTP